jgi:hypothetical protein
LRLLVALPYYGSPDPPVYDFADDLMRCEIPSRGEIDGWIPGHNEKMKR